MFKVLCILTLGLLSFGRATPALAELQAVPARIFLTEADPTAQISIRERGEKPVRYRIEVAYYKMKKDGSIEQIPDPLLGFRSAADYFRFSPHQITLAPNVEQIVRLQIRLPEIKLPEKLEDADYLAQINFETTDEGDPKVSASDNVAVPETRVPATGHEGSISGATSSAAASGESGREAASVAAPPVPPSAAATATTTPVPAPPPTPTPGATPVPIPMKTVDPQASLKVHTVRSVPVIVRKGNPTAKITLEDLKIAKQKDGTTGYSVEVVKAGNAVMFADFFLIFTAFAPDSKPMVVSQATGVPSYIDRRMVSYPLNVPSVETGTLTLEVRAPVSEGGKVLASATLDLK